MAKNVANYQLFVREQWLDCRYNNYTPVATHFSQSKSYLTTMDMQSNMAMDMYMDMHIKHLIINVAG